MKELKPCPRCGSTNVVAGEQRIGNRFVCGTQRYIICKDCCFQISGMFHELLIQEWNSTPPVMSEKKV